jgi:DNA-binding transcriptional regulator YdaS (Cro superfamily)
MKALSLRMRTARRRRENQHLDRAVAHSGSKSALGRQVGVSYQAIQSWYKERVPLERCPQVETATGGVVQCEQLREDYSLLAARPYRKRPQADAVYISGPMTGIADLNFPAFHAEARRLRNLGLRVINPAEVQLPADSPWATFLRVDLIDLLTHCDTVVVLPGWDRSKGAQLEVFVARQLGMRVVKAGEIG